jgi:hypothetical protein
MYTYIHICIIIYTYIIIYICILLDLTEEYGNVVDMLWTCSPFTIKKLIKRDKCHQWGPGEHSRRTTGIGEHPLCAGLFKMVLRQKNTVYNIYIYTVQISTVYKALCLHLKKEFM